MAKTAHKIQIIGRLGRNPEMRYTPSGQPVTTMSVATTRQYTNAQEEKKEETCWFRVTVWGKMAELCNQYLQKGSLVEIWGRMNPDANGNPRIWDKQDGTKGASFEVTANEVNFLDSRGANGNGEGAAEEEQPVGEINW